eukprot:2668867-Prymnesium_polylepis.1
MAANGMALAPTAGRRSPRSNLLGAGAWAYPCSARRWWGAAIARAPCLVRTGFDWILAACMRRRRAPHWWLSRTMPLRGCELTDGHWLSGRDLLIHELEARDSLYAHCACVARGSWLVMYAVLRPGYGRRGKRRRRFRVHGIACPRLPRSKVQGQGASPRTCLELDRGRDGRDVTVQTLDRIRVSKEFLFELRLSIDKHPARGTRAPR